MKKIDVEKLLERYSSDQGTELEKSIVENWYLKSYNSAPQFTHAQLQKDKTESLYKILFQHKNRQFFSWPKIAAIAATLILAVGTGLFYYNHTDKIQDISLTNDLAPGRNKAFLTLANGKKISLTDTKNGMVANQSGVSISKTTDGLLVYSLKDAGLHVHPATGKTSHYRDLTNPPEFFSEFNTIETPRGGQFQINLPDGTKVWLNAASSLKYPTMFAGEERKVELSGEAYFEVAKDKLHPFKVVTNKQEIEVLGTHFNVSSYRDEENTKTTLVEGRVKITMFSSAEKYNTAAQKKENKRITTVLEPGQQALLKEQDIQVSTVDPEEAIAWKDGFFYFDNTDLKTVMRQIARWYNVDISYQGNIPNRSFTGKLYKNVNASEILEILKYKKINYIIRDKKIIITP